MAVHTLFLIWFFQLFLCTFSPWKKTNNYGWIKRARDVKNQHRTLLNRCVYIVVVVFFFSLQFFCFPSFTFFWSGEGSRICWFRAISPCWCEDDVDRPLPIFFFIERVKWHEGQKSTCTKNWLEALWMRYWKVGRCANTPQVTHPLHQHEKRSWSYFPPYSHGLMVRLPTTKL